MNVRKQGGRIVFPREIKVRAVDLWQKGVSLKEICEHCSLAKSQLYQWKEYLKKSVPYQANLPVKEIPVISTPDQVLQKKRSYFFYLKVLSFKITWGY